jgi:hypothetical protein
MEVSSKLHAPTVLSPGKYPVTVKLIGLSDYIRYKVYENKTTVLLFHY